MPEQTLHLRERITLIDYPIAEVLRPIASVSVDEAPRDLFATALNRLDIRLSALGRREDALAAEEAVALRRELAAARPDAFRPNLALSLAVFTSCLEAAKRLPGALAVNRQAVEALRGPFLALPGAFVHWMQPMVQQYLQRLEALLVEPDGTLLEPILPVLMAMMEQAQGAPEEREGARWTR